MIWNTDRSKEINGADAQKAQYSNKAGHGALAEK
jgi:hypothetical protein